MISVVTCTSPMTRFINENGYRHDLAEILLKVALNTKIKSINRKWLKVHSYIYICNPNPISKSRFMTGLL